MRLLDLTCPTAEEDLALDEALLRDLDASVASGGDAGSGETLRFWESREPVVVLGRSRPAEEDVDLAACARLRVPVLRRASGGGTVVLGPGCLCFALVLSYDRHPAFRQVRRSYRAILGPIVAAIGSDGLAVRGTTDLALGDRKVSGNAQLRARHALLHQGTLLNGFETSLLARLLREPRRQPRYRAGRSHVDFVANLPLRRDELAARLAAAWSAGPSPAPPRVRP